MRTIDRNIWLLYGAALLLGLAYGLAIAVIAIYLDGRGYSKQDIGQLAAWFAAGLAVCSVPIGALIRRFSAKVVLVICLGGYAVTVALVPLMADNYWTLAGIRVLDGGFSVGVWICCETILLHRSLPHQKALVMSLYSIAIAVGYIAGPVLAKLLTGVIPMSSAFLIAGGIATLSSLLVWWRLERDDGTEHAHEISSAPTHVPLASALTWKIKTACMATFCYGYFQASAVLFMPLLFAETTSIPLDRIVVIPAFFAAGMFVFTTFAGRLGDRFGHLLIMRVLAVCGIPAVALIPGLDAYWAIAAATFIAGAMLASISPLSLALQGHVVEAKEVSRANAIYNAFYAVGMLLGPPITGYIFAYVGGPAMIYHLAVLWAAFVVFTIIFANDDPKARARRTPIPA